MPIKAEMRWFYPIDWPQLSQHVRFERAGGICQGCGRPHGVHCALPSGWTLVRRRSANLAQWPRSARSLA